jgi:hypothetical protein
MKHQRVVSLGTIPGQVSRRRRKRYEAPHGFAFEVVLTKKPYLLLLDRAGSLLLLNTLLPKEWKFVIKDGRSSDKIHVWVQPRRIIVPERQLQSGQPLLSLLHELGHVHVGHLTDTHYWKAYDKANRSYHFEDFSGLTRKEKHSLSPNELLIGRYYPYQRAVSKMPVQYRQTLLDIHRFKIADEYFAWAWAIRTLSQIYEAGFTPLPYVTEKSLQNYVNRMLKSHIQLAALSSGRNP